MNKTSTILLSTITALTLLLSTTGCTDSNSSAPKVTVDGVEYDLLHLTQQEIEDILLNFSLEQLTELVTQVQAMYDEALDKYSDSISDLAKEALDNVKALLAQKQAIVNAENEAEKQKAQEEADAKAAQLAANVKALADEAKKAETPPSVKKEVEKVIEVIEPEDNTGLVANDDMAFTTYETAVTIDVLANDTNSDGNKLAIETISDTNTKNGTITVVDNKILYTPNSGFSGTDKFSYSVNDENGNSDSGMVSVTVLAGFANTPATFSGDLTGNVTEDVGLVALGTVHITDPDPNEQGMKAENITGDYGLLIMGTGGSWMYDLANGAEVQALDEGETLTDTITVESIDGTQQDIVITIHGIWDSGNGGGTGEPDF